MASVEIRDVRKSFGSTEVIHGLSMDVKDGEFAILVGPSGCGKSTLLRMIAGLEEITEGEILIGESVVNEVPPKNRNVAMVFQNYALYPHMTVFNNMAFGLKLRRMSKPDIAERVHQAAEILGLTDYLDRYPRQLSGGQRQRVATGRAIVRDPEVYLFDEPLSNLDAMLRVQMRTEIKALQQRLHTTTVYVTHDQVEAMTMADRIFVMRDGNFEQIGTPLGIYENPKNIYVASFIGSPAMNLLEGTLRRNGDATWVETDGGTKLPLSQSFGGEHDRRVYYGIRPEHLNLADGSGAVAGEIALVEPTGAETLIFVKVANNELRATFAGRNDFHSGQKLSLLPDIDRVRLFDAASGERID